MAASEQTFPHLGSLDATAAGPAASKYPSTPSFADTHRHKDEADR